MADIATLRRNMVDCQLRIYDVTDRAVLAAFEAVPRELFVPPEALALAYLDQQVPYAAWGASGRAALAPIVLARMIQSLRIVAGERALVVAGGAGYAAAILYRLGAEVVLHETDTDLRAQATSALPAAGAARVEIAESLPAGPFDAILLDGAYEREPEELLERLGDGGRLVGVRGQGRSGRVMLYTSTEGVVSGRPVFDAAAPLIGQFAKPEAFVF